MDLCKAIQHGSLDTINGLISKKGFTTNSEWLDYAALNSAIKYGRKDVVQLLLQKNCRVNKTVVSSGDTPLHAAVQLADQQLVLDLLKRKASTVALDADNNSPLHVAFLQKQETLVDLMLDSIEKNSQFLNRKNNQGLSHLHIACTRSNAKAIEGFLNNGASARDLISNDSVLWAGYSAYHFAADFKSLTAIRILSNRNSGEFSFWCIQPNDQGKTPVNLINQHLEELSIIAGLMNRCTFSPFHMACIGNDSKILRRFLENGAGANRHISKTGDKKFSVSWSPLHFAAKSTNSQNVELLLAYRANPNYRNKDEMCPVQSVLYDEVSMNNDKIGQILYNATMNKLHELPDKNGLSFMHVACSRNDLATVKQFLEKGEDIDSKVTYEHQELYHYTPLHIAVKYGNLEVIKYLVQRGANINANDNCVDGTPLNLACRMGHLEIIDFLLENGADAKVVRSHDQKTSLHLLIEYWLQQSFYDDDSALKYVSKLIKFGVDVNAQDKKGNTVLHFCERFSVGKRYLKILLDIGADINIENNAGDTSFEIQISSAYFVLRNQPGDHTILYHHVQKLKAIGFEVNPKNERCCKRLLQKPAKGWDMDSLDFKNDELARKQQQRIDEVNRMKSIKLNNNVSLYDFIKLEPEQAKNYVTHASLMEVLQKEFPVYGYLLRLQHQKAVDVVGVKVEGSNKRRAVKIGADSSSKRRRSK